jgi:RNA methyltransferase, TrmH family
MGVHHGWRMTEPELTSASNPRIRAAAALRDRRWRERSGLTIVDGAREVLRAAEASVDIVEAFVCEPLVRTDDAHAAVTALRSAGVPVRTASEVAFAKLAFGDRAEGMVAVIRPPSTGLADLHLAPDPLVVVLESVEKPGNLGAVLRSADGAGADALLLADPLTDPWNPNAIRASVGTVFTVPIAAGSGDEVRAFLAASGLRTVAARVDAAALHWEADLRGPLAIVLGSEQAGLTDAWTSPTSDTVRLPMLGTADSLNVSVAAAVLLYEARRQRDTHLPPE